MEEHGNGSSTAMEKPSFMTTRMQVRCMSSEQLEERKIYYIHVLEHPNLCTFNMEPRSGYLYILCSMLNIIDNVKYITRPLR